MSARLPTLEPWLVLSHAVWLHINYEVWTAWEIWRVRFICLHPPVGYSGSPSTVNETTCNKKVTKIFLRSPPTPSRRVPPSITRGRMPSPTLLRRSWFCNLLTWLAVETVFERDCSSKIGSKSHRPFFVWLVQGEIPLSLVPLKFFCREMVRLIFVFASFVHVFALLFCPSDCELWFTIDLILCEIDREYL